jgi:outer membrane protein OmpA-like peptidoglycan-associated protein
MSLYSFRGNKMIKRNTFAVAAVALGLSSGAMIGSAMADDYQGLYLGARGGLTWLDDTSLSTASPNGGVGRHLEFDNGYNVSGFVGMDLGMFRVEGEVSYRQNDIDSIRAGGVRLGGARGDASTLAFMVNGYYDFDFGWPLVPYVGAGIGIAQYSASGITGTGLGFTVDDDETKLAYQGIVGVSYAITDALSLSADYRYFATQEPHLRASTGSAFEVDNTTHNVTVGLTLRFPAPRMMAPAPQPAAAPPPPPPPAPMAAAPAPAVPKTYLVFFDFDRTDITPEAARIITQAADDAKRGNVRLIVATGHADRSGTPAYNQRLSERRATAVKGALVRNGVADNAIQTNGKGEGDPLVPTADGVREPRNRRVEIVFR